jgi:hypothetical protein
MNSLTRKSWLGRIVGSLALAALVFTSAAPALAAGDGAPPAQEESGERGVARLELAYLRLQHAAEDQALHLDHAVDVADFVAEWIETLAGQGQDVSRLQAALDAFQAALAEAQGYHQQAEAVLEVHSGFDENGKVTDREQAVETLRQAGRSLQDARRALKDGAIELRRAVRDWRREHRLEPAQS